MATIDDLLTLSRARDAAARTLAELDGQYEQMTQELVGEVTRNLLDEHPELVRYSLSVRVSEFDDSGPDQGVQLHSLQLTGDVDDREVRTGYNGEWFCYDSDELSAEHIRLAQVIQDTIAPMSVQGLWKMADGETIWDESYVIQVSAEGIHLARWR